MVQWHMIRHIHRDSGCYECEMQAAKLFHRVFINTVLYRFRVIVKKAGQDRTGQVRTTRLS